jgi:hypothetical protein
MNLSSLGLHPPDCSPPPKGLPRLLRGIDSQLWHAEDNAVAIGCDINRLRLWIEDMAILIKEGCMPSQEEFAELRELASSLAAATGNMLGELKDARGQIHERAQRGAVIHLLPGPGGADA